MMAQPVKIIPRNYYNVIIAKIWPHRIALDLIVSWERLYSNSGIHGPSWSEIFLFYYWSDFGRCRPIRICTSSCGSVWFDMDLNWDGQFDVRLSISYDRSHIIHIILCYNYGYYNQSSVIIQFDNMQLAICTLHVNLSNANMIQL